MIKLFVAIPTVGVIADSIPFTLREMEKRYGDRIEFIYPKVCIRRIFHDFARNEMVEEFLASGADILWFLDSDVTPPPDVMDIVLKHEKWDLAGAPYPVFMTPPNMTTPQVVFTVYDGRYSGGLGTANVPMEGEAFVDGLGTGCIFIKRAVLEKMSKPYFEFHYDKTNRQMTRGEDLGFCRKINDLGYKFYVDYSMACRHQKSVCLLDVNNYAREYAQRSVNQYADMIKGQVQALQDRVKSMQDKHKKDKLIEKVSGRIIQAPSGLAFKP